MLDNSHFKEFTNSEEIKAILETAHFHVQDQFPETGIIWKSGAVILPNKEQHLVQFTFTKPGQYSLWCWTCNKPYCPIAIAVLVKTYLEEIKDKYTLETEKNCPVCGQEFHHVHPTF